MNIKLQKSTIKNEQSQIAITGSKSESNRLLVLQAFYPEIQIENLSNSDDTLVIIEALSSESQIINVHHAGTAMRFLTAYFAIQEGREVTLTGSQRMKERPVKILVEALNKLGANISYLEKEGYPPLKIIGRQLKEDDITLKANISSQYISALILIASKLENGLKLKLEGEVTSIPYIKMTLSLLENLNINTSFNENVITVKPRIHNQQSKSIIVESDWSSASYFYSLVALSNLETQITLTAYKKNSLQGDSSLVEIYKQFGVETTFLENSIVLKKVKTSLQKLVELDLNLNLNDSPDIAQTIAVTCFGLGISCYLKGIHTLKIKETNRLLALKTELEKLNGIVHITDSSLHLESASEIKEHVSINTYNDHRMAMAFAPLVIKTNLTINNAEVVSKSYPTFWSDLKTLGIKVSE